MIIVILLLTLSYALAPIQKVVDSGIVPRILEILASESEIQFQVPDLESLFSIIIRLKVHGVSLIFALEKKRNLQRISLNLAVLILSSIYSTLKLKKLSLM